MPRVVEITLPAAHAEKLLARFAPMDCVVGIVRLPGASIKPMGDTIRLQVTNRGWRKIMAELAESGIGTHENTSLQTSDPLTLVSPSAVEAIRDDSSEATWEEMHVVIGKSSTMTFSSLVVMAISGVLATLGIATNALHLVMAAMLIAPGFQPIVRIVLGWATQSRTWRRGIRDTLLGYVVLAAAAAATSATLTLFGKSPVPGDSSYIAAGELASYWLSYGGTAAVVSLLAGAAGTLLIMNDRAVMTAGVMVGLALVPGAALAGIGIGIGDWSLMVDGWMRWGFEFLCVITSSLLVMVPVRLWRQRRRMLL